MFCIAVRPNNVEKYSEVRYGMRTKVCPTTKACAAATMRLVATVTVEA